MGISERRAERKEKRPIGGLISNANGLMAKADALISAFDAEEIEEFINQLENLFPKVSHLASLAYALTEDLEPDDIRKIKAKIKEGIAAIKAKLDKDKDGDIDFDDLKLIVVEHLPFPLSMVFRYMTKALPKSIGPSTSGT